MPPRPTQTALPVQVTVTALLDYETTRLPELYSPLADHAIEDLPGAVSSPYTGPPVGDDSRHHGVDFFYITDEGQGSIEGEVVQAVLPGLVVSAQDDTLPYGNMVIIETPYRDVPGVFFQVWEFHPGESLYHLYAHFSGPPEVDLGDRVEGGERLGQVGKTGYYIIIPHLHFETRIGPSGALFEHMAYYDVSSTSEERESYELWRMSGVFEHFDPMRLFETYLEASGE
jgi:murein DD-endopeptidase MepM/ murein hydrolase activator NlpD